VLAGALPLGLLLLLWQGLAASGAAPAALLPAPWAVFRRCAEDAGDPIFLGHLATTLLRLLCGFGIAVVLGIIGGIAAAASGTAALLFTPVVRVLAPVPKIALYPAFILVLGFDHASKIALVAADALFPILLATYQGARAVDDVLVWSALAAGASRRRALFTVVLPAALPSVLTGCRIGLVVSAIVVFLAEMITSTDGLGHLLIYAARSLQTLDMFVPLITIAALGLALNAAFGALSGLLLAPYPRAD
jgi:ABC-type nitrate/sulfonate/bicarbonate transport system permease component